ncbi:DUF3320 domain-containing protein [Williamsia sp.]|uniref:DUF3320 domain-containing protein n=1 Tax=Williamsia sp. TaxID=1872085 RepID=UPI001A266A45|nr:DUF3320 domain-containing protein [Williamsia sp.]MBJ7289171.1 DUF3320 domain-containing protein [Williamsia sp.]
MAAAEVDVGEGQDLPTGLNGDALPGDTAAPLEPRIQARLDSTLAKWRDSLLAMDRRQRLLYFKHLKAGTLEFDHASPLETLSMLADTTVPVRPALTEGQARLARSLYVKDKQDEQLRPAMRRIEQASGQAFADRGVWTLYLGLLMLHWVDSNDDGAQVDSPVLLVPVRVVKTGADSPYVLERTEDDITVNPVLKLKLSEYGVELPEVDPDDVSMQMFVLELEESINGHASWRIDQRMVLGNFTFQKEAMYQDLLANSAEIAEHGMVQLLALGPEAPSHDDYGFDELSLDGLDEAKPPESMFSILDADSSQRRCIISATDGRSFVMDGPPGTGKSQTIANMIAELMAAGKTVLFVSEKAAALDVVRDRLTNAGLSHFLFELHSHSATRKEVAAELSRTLQNRVKPSNSFSDQDARSLVRDRRQLTDFANAMNSVDPKLGWSLFAVLGRLSELDIGVDASLPKHQRWAGLSEADLSEIRDHAENLGRSWDAVHRGDEYLWRDLKRDDVDASEVRECRRLVSRAIEGLGLLQDRLHTIDEDLGLKLDSSAESLNARLSLLAELDLRRPGFPVWYDHSDLETIEGRLAQGQAAVNEIALETESLHESGYVRWREINPSLSAPLSQALNNDRIVNSSTARDMDGIATTLTALNVTAGEVLSDVAELVEILGLSDTDVSMQRSGDISRLAQLASAQNRPEAFWLNTVEVERVVQAARAMDAVVEHVNRRHQALHTVFTPAALELDLPSLVVRFRETHVGFRKWGGAARRDRKLIKAVSVSGRTDKSVLGHLEEAASWQQAVSDMRRAEGTHARELGSRYQGTQTEFGEIGSAIGNAREALRLAGIDANPAALAAQLSMHSTPNPRLLPLAQRVTLAEQKFGRLLQSLPAELKSQVSEKASLVATRGWLTSAVDETDLVRHVVEVVSSIAQRDLTVLQAAELVGQAGNVIRLEAAQGEFCASDVANFGDELSLATDFEGLRYAIGHSKAVQRLYPRAIDADDARRLDRCVIPQSELACRHDAWIVRRDELFALFLDRRVAELRAECDPGLDQALELFEEMEETAPREIEMWCAAQRELRWAATIQLDSILLELKRQPRSQNEVAAAVEYVVLEAWVDDRTSRDTRLLDYRSNSRDDLVARYQDLDRALIRNAHARVIDRCNSRAPSSLTSRSASVIKREGEKKTRHKPVRLLLDEASGLVQQLKPCFMMSPLSVSQYLPRSVRFDVVIFDEASQVLPSDALNCIYRGSQLIVAGDQKQLPPTDFFSAAADEADEDEDNEASDFQSVLDLAKGAGGLSSLPLNWHYRSRHEDLIAYSNHRFYDGRLMTFPGAVFDAPDLGVSLLPVNGVYRRGTSRDNPIEASKVVERLIWFRRHRPNDSIGVVTFSGAQADRVLQEIEAQSAQNPVLAGILTDHDRLGGFFVKSLENVQGDERDIILFSVGYGPDENRKFTANFGPLNRDGGWRRLNVATTRARKRIEVVSSFIAAEMPSTSNPSILHLQQYLDFAERGHAALALEIRESEGEAESVFEEQVIARIRSWGYTVVPQVGVAGYRIDMAIRHPERPGEYALGIECDGAAYHSGQTARDRDRLRQQVLEGLGWRLHRIWGLSWWRDRALQEGRLKANIEEAIRLSGSQTTRARQPESVAEEVTYEEVLDGADFDWTIEYVEYEGSPLRARDPKTIEGVRDMAEYFGKVIRAEAPIHRELLHERFREAWGVGRIGAQIRKSVDEALARAHERGPDTEGFYRVRDAKTTSVRIPGEHSGERKVSLVPPEEIEHTMLRLVQDAVVLDETTLVKQTAAVFGWQRLGAEIRASLSGIVTRLVANELLLREGAEDLRLVFDE